MYLPANNPNYEKEDQRNDVHSDTQAPTRLPDTSPVMAEKFRARYPRFKGTSEDHAVRYHQGHRDLRYNSLEADGGHEVDPQDDEWHDGREAYTSAWKALLVEVLRQISIGITAHSPGPSLHSPLTSLL